MNNRQKSQTISKDERKGLITATTRATKEISELPKDVGWKTNGAFVAEIADKVIEICERVGLLPTMGLLASALGVPKDTLEDVRTQFLKVNADVYETVCAFFQVCENVLVQSTLNGAVNYASGIFMSKALHGFKEEPREIVMTHNKLLGGAKDAKAIAEKYASAVVDAKPEELRDIDF